MGVSFGTIESIDGQHCRTDVCALRSALDSFNPAILMERKGTLARYVV